MPRRMLTEGQLQLSAMHLSRTYEHHHKRLSLRSFYTMDDSDSEQKSEMLRTFSNISLVGDYPLDNRGKHTMPGGLNHNALGKSFRKKVKKIAKKEKRHANHDYDEGDEIEFPRGAVNRIAVEKKRSTAETLTQLVATVQNNVNHSTNLNDKERQFKDIRTKLFAARTAIDIQPRLLERTREKITEKNRTGRGLYEDSPGVLSLCASKVYEHIPDKDYIEASICIIPETVTDAKMHTLVAQCRKDSDLIQHLLYSQKYDNKWKNHYTDIFMSEMRGKEKKPVNKQGWVLPLKEICKKVAISAKYFTDNRTITLEKARSYVLRQRLSINYEPSVWLSELDPHSTRNHVLLSFLSKNFDPHALQSRIALYNENIYSDRDRVRVAGKYYNNIQLGKRMFGPSKKQKFIRTITGGMERRFEILDNQVNHLPFTHKVSDEYPEKCRNIRVHCRDSSRVVLHYPPGTSNDFIHANRIVGGPLFNEFIITQAPLDDTIGDFWRMVWQERVPYIFMLISRKEKERCAEYWPRRMNSTIFVCDLQILNVGINTTKDPLFRVTFIKITGPNGNEHRVEHWQADMNNSSNVQSPLKLLQIARNCSHPVIIHDHLGISRAACLVAAEIAICNLIKGPTYKHPIQKAVHFLRLYRPFSVETPMQYIFIHRIIQRFFCEPNGGVREMEADYKKWLSERTGRMFIDDLEASIPGYRLLSPRIDPDLLRLVRHPQRPNHRREAPDCVGELPVPLERTEFLSGPRRKIY